MRIAAGTGGTADEPLVAKDAPVGCLDGHLLARDVVRSSTLQNLSPLRQGKGGSNGEKE